MTERCNVPPPGWWCSRDAGHPPPCAARPTTGDAVWSFEDNIDGRRSVTIRSGGVLVHRCSHQLGSEETPRPTKSAGIVLVVREDGNVLVAWNRRFGGWSLPGGKADEGELPVVAAAREFSEECGSFVLPTNLVWLATVPSPAQPEYLVHLFLARQIFGEPKQVEEDTKLAWITLEELRESKPFGASNAQHFPTGVHHFKPTKIL